MTHITIPVRRTDFSLPSSRFANGITVGRNFSADEWRLYFSGREVPQDL
jgi:hypothetical protein